MRQQWPLQQVKNHSLHQHLEMIFSEAITVLHDICIGGTLKPSRSVDCKQITKSVLLCFFPGHVKFVPAVFDNAQEDCMKECLVMDPELMKYVICKY